jgi:osmoprotectant transport system ATP-binding protein
MIRFEHVEQRYAPSRAVLSGVSFELPRGQLGALLGASGSGKTTALKLVNRLLEPSGGRVLVDGRDVLSGDPIPLRRSIGYVFQRFGLFPHLTLAENVAVGPRLAGWSARDITARARELLALLGLPPELYVGRYPRELSGGQQQRVGLARALASRPRIMLMDEPFGALDVVTRSELQVSYRRLHDELGLTTLMVTHDVVEALLMADRVFVLHEGLIAFDGAPGELLAAPPPGPVAQLLDVARRQLSSLGAPTRGAR